MGKPGGFWLGPGLHLCDAWPRSGLLQGPARELPGVTVLCGFVLMEDGEIWEPPRKWHYSIHSVWVHSFKPIIHLSMRAPAPSEGHSQGSSKIFIPPTEVQLCWRGKAWPGLLGDNGSRSPDGHVHLPSSWLTQGLAQLWVGKTNDLPSPWASVVPPYRSESPWDHPDTSTGKINKTNPSDSENMGLG